MDHSDLFDTLLDLWENELPLDDEAFLDLHGKTLTCEERSVLLERMAHLRSVNQRLDVLRQSENSIEAVPTRSSSPFHEGEEIVPGYQLVELIGEGGYGEVWKAIGPGGFLVALKILKESSFVNIEKNGLPLLRRISHPNLIPVFGTWETPHGVVIAMQLAEKSLESEFRELKLRSETFPKETLLDYFSAIAKAIDYMNFPGNSGRPKIQHGDVKPDNMFLSGGSIQLGDFSLVKSFKHTYTAHPGSLTLSFAAPECIKGLFSDYSDQYSLAVSWYYLRRGHVPFEGSIPEVLHKHISVAPDLSFFPHAERIAIKRALAKNPNSRWSSCSQFVEMLAKSDPVPRKRKGLWLAAGACVVVLAVVFAMLYKMQVVKDEVTDSEVASNVLRKPLGPVNDPPVTVQAPPKVDELKTVPAKPKVDKPKTTPAKPKVDEPKNAPAKPKVDEPKAASAKPRVEEPKTAPAKPKVEEPKPATKARKLTSAELSRLPLPTTPEGKKAEWERLSYAHKNVGLFNHEWKRMLTLSSDVSDNLKASQLQEDGHYIPMSDRLITIPKPAVPEWNPIKALTKACGKLSTRELTAFSLLAEFEVSLINMLELQLLNMGDKYKELYATDPLLYLNHCLVNQSRQYNLLIDQIPCCNISSNALTDTHLALDAYDEILFWSNVMLADSKYLVPYEEREKDSVNGSRRRQGLDHSNKVIQALDTSVFTCKIMALLAMGRYDEAVQVRQEVDKYCPQDSDQHEMNAKLFDKTPPVQGAKAEEVARKSKYTSHCVNAELVERFVRYQDRDVQIFTPRENIQEYKDFKLGEFFRLYHEVAKGATVNTPLKSRYCTNALQYRIAESLQYAHGRYWLVCHEVFHLAGCYHVPPFDPTKPAQGAESRRVVLGAGPAKSILTNEWEVYSWSNNADDIVDKAKTFCPICVPWLAFSPKSRSAAKAREISLANLQKLLDPNNTLTLPERTATLNYFYAFPDPTLRETIRKLAKQLDQGEIIYNIEYPKAVLSALAVIATFEDRMWLVEQMKSNVSWTVRASAAAVLGNIGGSELLPVFAAAIDKEPYYFVRRQMEAALARIIKRYEAEDTANGKQKNYKVLTPFLRALEDLNRAVNYVWYASVALVKGFDS